MTLVKDVFDSCLSKKALIRSDSGWWSSRRLYGCLLARDVADRRGRSPLSPLGGRSLHNNVCWS